jgi:hypothetical protein
MIDVGSFVIYTERKSPNIERNRGRPRNGSIGVVVAVTLGYHHQRNAFDVNWISGGCVEEQRRKLTYNGWYAVWAENLDLAEQPYDPTQQGDTEDDI